MTSYMSEAEVNARALSEGPPEPTPSVFIMGAGVVGTALAARLVRAGIPVIGLHGRQVELTDAARAISGVVGSTKFDAKIWYFDMEDIFPQRRLCLSLLPNF